MKRRERKRWKAGEGQQVTTSTMLIGYDWRAYSTMTESWALILPRQMIQNRSAYFINFLTSFSASHWLISLRTLLCMGGWCYLGLPGAFPGMILFRGAGLTPTKISFSISTEMCASRSERRGLWIRGKALDSRSCLRVAKV